MAPRPLSILNMTAAIALAVTACAGLLAAAEARTQTGDVTLVELPNSGVQPQIAIDASGTMHVLYFQGEAAHGNLFYTRLNPTSLQFSPAVRVNTQPESAVATGSMRGGQMAIGRDGRLHVAWDGSSKATSRAPAGKTPVLYTRLNDARTAFEPERNLVQMSVDADAAGVAADANGNVYVAWHAQVPGGVSEADRRVWIARSSNDGGAFLPEAAVSNAAAGACGCCGVRALADRRGVVRLLVRSAVEMMNRDTYLLTSYDKGVTFSSDLMQPWNVGACPMSTFSLSEVGTDVLAAWETGGQLQWLRIDESTSRRSNWTTPAGSATNRRYPSIAGNARGEVALAWIEGASWNRGGSLAWQRFGADGKPMGAIGRKPGLPTWDTPAVVVKPDGSFIVIY
ncbi:MAG: hypothetical protein ABI634_18640 [Acidobacteriota bacterium]